MLLIGQQGALTSVQKFYTKEKFTGAGSLILLANFRFATTMKSGTTTRFHSLNIFCWKHFKVRSLVQLFLKDVSCKLKDGTKPGAANVRQKNSCIRTRFRCFANLELPI